MHIGCTCCPLGQGCSCSFTQPSGRELLTCQALEVTKSRWGPRFRQLFWEGLFVQARSAHCHRQCIKRVSQPRLPAVSCSPAPLCFGGDALVSISDCASGHPLDEEACDAPHFSGRSCWPSLNSATSSHCSKWVSCTD